MNSITIRIMDLEEILRKAKEQIKRDSDLIPVIEIESAKHGKYHGDSDTMRIRILSAYAECDSKTLTYINF